MEDSVFDHLTRVELQVRAFADEADRREAEVKVLREKVYNLELALELASNAARSRYLHWSYQTYLFLRWYFAFHANVGKRWGLRYAFFYIRTPLFAFGMYKAAPCLYSTVLENAIEFDWIPDLPVETGKLLYKHRWRKSQVVKTLYELEKR